MKRPVFIAVMVIATGCGDNLLGDDGGVPDTSPPIDMSPPIDTSPPIDAPPPNLIELCGAEPVTFEDWENCYQKRWCEWLVGCVPRNRYSGVQECLDESDKLSGGRLTAEFRERMRAVAAERAWIDEDAFTQCLAETSAAHCNTARSSVACATRFTGTIDDGQCYTDIECTSPGATCESDCTESCCLGTCRPKFEEGESCVESYSCEPGLRCAGDGMCWSGDIGDSCTYDLDCDPNAWCNDGNCEADLPLGAACTSILQCSGDTLCIGLSIVDPSPGQCLSVSKPGDRCDNVCYGNLYCDASGTCRNLPGLGESCSAFTSCRGVDLVCSNGLCVLRSDIGEACSGSQPCQPGLFCTSELNDSNPVCAPPGGTEAPCADPSQCESYLCSGDTGQPGECLAWSDTCLLGGS